MLVQPNLLGDVDYRQHLFAADVILGKDTKSGRVLCIYGEELLGADGKVPGGAKTVVVRLDIENKKTLEFEKMHFAVQRIKGLHDYE